jgi:DNA-binding CsgD family transcriptional regulator/predicted negative regulator of RcsB-dependent stress response
VSAVLLERDADLAAAEAVLREVVGTRTGRLIVVEGVPGVGKTEVLLELTRRAQALGLQVAAATAGELEQDLPFGVARQLFVDDVAAHAKTPAAAALGLESAKAPSDVQSAELDALHSLFGLCSARTESGALAVVVDDVHWADPASLKFIVYLARRLGALPVALVLATRPTALSARAPELELLVERADLTLKLETLSAEATAAVARGWFGDLPSESFTRVCVDTTGGNPLLLRQLLEEAAAEQLQPIDADAARLRELGSTTVARSALLRVSKLGRAAVDIAATTALLGRSASLPLVAAVAGMPAEQAELVVDELVEAHLLKPGQPLHFVHPLVQSAIYRHMPRGLRSRRHRESARLLALGGAPHDEIGRHLLRTDPAGDAWVREQLREAGTHALETGAPDVAVALLRRAVDEDPTSVDPRLLLQLGGAESVIRDRQALTHLSQAMTSTDDPALRALAALPLSRALAERRRYAEGIDALESVLADPSDLDAETLLRLRCERLWLLGTSDLPASTFMQEAEELATGLTGATHAERLTLGHLATIRLSQSVPHDEGRTLTLTALGGGQLLREEGPESPRWLHTASMLWVFGDYAAAERELLRGEQLAHDRGSDAPLLPIRSTRALLAFDIGELDRAEELARNAIARTRGFGSTGARFATACLVRVLTEKGLLDEAAAILDQAPAPGDALDRFDTLLVNARGGLRLAQHDDTGIDDLLTVGRWCEEHGVKNPGEWPWRTDVAPALAAAGDLDRAQELIDEELERARAFGVARPLGRALHAAGQIARGDDRLPFFEEAVAVLAPSAARLATARALLSLGVARRAAGQVSEAQEPFRQALDLATGCGATPIAEAARRLLLSTGARPRRTALIGPDALTPSEREVAELAARGHTNREIAGRLFVTVKAVEKHLRNAYAKLDIERRTELAAALRGGARQTG